MHTKKQGRKLRLPQLAVFLTFWLLLSEVTAGAGEILLSQVGSGQWQVSYADIKNAQALDLQLHYDPQRLAGLTVTAGAGLTGAMSAINDKTPGLIRLGVASTQPLPASGILLKLQSSVPGAELVVKLFTVKIVDGDGKVAPATLRQQLPLVPSLPPTPTESVTPPSEPSPLMVTPRRGGFVAGSVTLPEGSSPATEKISPAALPTSVLEPGRAAPPVSGQAVTAPPAFSGPEKRFHSQEEIVTAIERLPQPWTVGALKAIFLKPASVSPVRQVPPVALADGTSRVSLYLPKALSQKMPTVGVQGCTLGSIWDAREQGWEVELVTRKEIWPATALLLGEGDLIQFPVVIVPVLKITAPVNDHAVIPFVDFDGNGAVTALDAYLYVGNLLTKSVP
jgi:hypothetical protein